VAIAVPGGAVVKIAPVSAASASIAVKPPWTLPAGLASQRLHGSSHSTLPSSANVGRMPVRW
jgi:hypothetical protein